MNIDWVEWLGRGMQLAIAVVVVGGVYGRPPRPVENKTPYARWRSRTWKPWTIEHTYPGRNSNALRRQSATPVIGTTTTRTTDNMLLRFEFPSDIRREHKEMDRVHFRDRCSG
jgi:hypothetical protein